LIPTIGAVTQGHWMDHASAISAIGALRFFAISSTLLLTRLSPGYLYSRNLGYIKPQTAKEIGLT